MSFKGEFSSKVVIVTGSASGIGKATAFQFASLGANLVLYDVNKKGLESVAVEILDKGGQRVSFFFFSAMKL